MDSNRFQRVGAPSNTHAGQEFEEATMHYLGKSGIRLRPNFPIPIGYKIKKLHRFDLGSDDPPILVECKSYTWTSGGNSPSAKIRGMNEAMLHFAVAPEQYRKMLFVLRHLKAGLSLATHYVRTQGHLIGPGIEVWELDINNNQAERLL